MKFDLHKLKTDRRYLAQLLTILESTREEDVHARHKILEDIFPLSTRSLRIGISGVPGVGKSTFIEALGLHAITSGYKVAVLAIDPSSPVSKGSILADKTRMTRLSHSEQAFVRPSPSKGELGGVARRTRETILLLEAAGYDFILIETVGVGQSEAAVVDMVDISVLLLPPVGGDSIQGMKKGLLELVDLIVVNKADGDLISRANLMVKEYTQALKLLSGKERHSILSCSALENTHIDQVYDTLVELDEYMRKSGEFEERRQNQWKKWFEDEVKHEILNAAFKDHSFQRKYHQALDCLEQQKDIPSILAERLLY